MQMFEIESDVLRITPDLITVLLKQYFGEMGYPYSVTVKELHGLQCSQPTTDDPQATLTHSH